ncbi:hypothetical protein [Leptotrichia hofstadii]|uniref:MORN repeat protein n=1 Tax=Leptotrichia hofstadii F0254 TaxID=634994 RepID=C9MU94_9FUSO|nr:hypothetical protein [Leptotrichia hofstadii]EEX75901.1 hypothetical protein GCWU000323_00113 [Leptotrichia hofstadii F0254]
MKIFRKSVIIAVLVSLVSFGNVNVESKIAQIRKDFMSTNTAKNYAIREADDSDRSTESGIVKYYSQNGIVKKIVVEHYGEIWNGLTEYYIKNGKVYFIFDKTEKYNVPYYVNADWYKRDNMKVGEVFDSRKSKISEKRYYFDENMKLIRYVGENKKIVENVQKLKEIEKNVLDEYFRIKNKN